MGHHPELLSSSLNTLTSTSLITNIHSKCPTLQLSMMTRLILSKITALSFFLTNFCQEVQKHCNKISFFKITVTQCSMNLSRCFYKIWEFPERKVTSSALVYFKQMIRLPTLFTELVCIAVSLKTTFCFFLLFMGITFVSWLFHLTKCKNISLYLVSIWSGLSLLARHLCECGKTFWCQNINKIKTRFVCSEA